MTMRVGFGLGIAVCALAACSPQVPDSGAGVLDPQAISSEARASAARDAQLSGTVPAQAPQTTAAGDPTLLSPVRTDGDLTRGQATGAPTSGEISAALGQQTAPGAPSTALRQPRSGGLSDEQDFQAVSARESIESDAARIEQQRAQYQQVQPTAVPERPDSGEPNLVAFALRTQNAPGQQLYGRAFPSDARAARACATFASPDRAQAWFLANGGPQKNPKGIDPDGDGFVCGWDPRPFRSVRAAG